MKNHFAYVPDGPRFIGHLVAPFNERGFKDSSPRPAIVHETFAFANVASLNKESPRVFTAMDSIFYCEESKVCEPRCND